MIELVEITDPKRTPVKWWAKVKQLKRKKVRFKPGINIIWGPNGSGKSTLLTAIAHLTHSKQSGRSVVTHQSLRALRPSFLSDEVLDGMQVHCDGQSVLYFCPEDTVGVMAGAAFDDDFFLEGAQSIFSAQSSAGQQALLKFRSILQHKKKPVEWRVDQSEVAEFVQSNLSARCDAGPQTIIMDEPDANLDWPNRFDLWDLLRTVAGNFQQIIATHSPFALRCPGAHYIELERGYRKKCEAVLAAQGLWTEDWKGPKWQDPEQGSR